MARCYAQRVWTAHPIDATAAITLTELNIPLCQ
ncbi:Uncharacterised protein [Nocardia cyriacigeorgica]|uniref:Uncharacterized protein n=1 Tax=Nocardia cyriacigeorgica TaxID=135487 RepID=A0A4U8W5F4_9NOCA|nr:Uncharacterised protein [Nocardia cyriacigeorgica]